MSNFESFLKKTGEIGKVVSVTHSVIRVSGLPNLKPKEMVITENGKKGMTFSLSENLAEVFIFDMEGLKVGERVARTGQIFKIPINQNLLGRMVDPFCQPIDGLGPVGGEKSFWDIEKKAPNIFKRAYINRPLETGITIVDLLVPLGYGQRELVIGDGKTGKTTFLLQTMLSQAKKGVVCIYVSIGKEASQVKMVEEYMKKTGVFDKVIIIVAPSNSPATTIYLSPYSGMAIAEYFREKNIDTMIVLDDLTTHAKIYREISLLLKRFPGRSVYPGDIFHIQATLLERAGNIKGKNGNEVSITALPVAETLGNDISGYIQTNLMAMTDGHVFFDIEEYKKGRRPAINAFLSVSRVGNQTQTTLDKELANFVRRKLVEYQRVLGVVQFGIELPEKTKELIDFGEKVITLFNQTARAIIPREFQLLIFGLLLSGFWGGSSPKVTGAISKEVLKHYREGKFPEVNNRIKGLKNLEELKTFAQEITPKINQVCYDNSEKN